MSRIRLALAAPVALLGFAAQFVGLAGPASAQDATKTVGPYTITTGWVTSPPYVGFQNTMQFIVNDSDGNGVDGLADGLKLVVSVNNQKSDPMSLSASFDPTTNQGTHGEYDAAIIPTQAGDYTFHFIGNIKGQPLDESFTSSDKTFESVQDPSSIEFPSSLPNATQLAGTTAGLSSRVSGLNNRVSLASSSSGTAIALGISALVVALVLGGAGLVLGIMAHQRATKPATISPGHSDE
jgi:hypothetical protein